MRQRRAFHTKPQSFSNTPSPQGAPEGGTCAPAPGPLQGVPLAHKDMYYRVGKVATCGSRIRRDWVAPVTSTALARLEAAGSINLGTLNLADLSAR